MNVHMQLRKERERERERHSTYLDYTNTTTSKSIVTMMATNTPSVLVDLHVVLIREQTTGKQ